MKTKADPSTFRPVPALYRAFVTNIRRRKAELAWTMSELDRRVGCQDGYSAHLLTPEKPTGRMGRWLIMDEVVTAAFGRGFRLYVLPANDPLIPVIDACLGGRSEPSALPPLDNPANDDRAPTAA